MTTDKKIKCENCGNPTPSYKTVCLSSADNLQTICLKCYNKTIAGALGEDYQHMDFEPIIIKDSDEIEHRFHFLHRLQGHIQTIESFELAEGSPGGYEFSVIGDPEEDLFELFTKLYERMKRALNKKHIYRDEGTRSWQISDKDIVHGQISCEHDSSDFDRTPLVIIDGKEISWEDFGQMLMTYEGFNFKFQIFDRSDEMD
jgi:hypothetical protein